MLGKLSRQKKSSQSTFEPGAAFGTYLARAGRAGSAPLGPDSRRAPRDPRLGRLRVPVHAEHDARADADTGGPAHRAGRRTGVRAMGTDVTLTDDDARAIRLATLGYLDTMEEIAQRKLALSLGAKERVT